ncbi:MAG: hypothetical protein ABMA25_21465 [Ilumatobacteraceae bacterium]
MAGGGTSLGSWIGAHRTKAFAIVTGALVLAAIAAVAAAPTDTPRREWLLFVEGGSLAYALVAAWFTPRVQPRATANAILLSRVALLVSPVLTAVASTIGGAPTWALPVVVIACIAALAVALLRT